MHGGKADIKSKKTKLQEKRNDKLKYAPKPIQISSEEEEQQPLPIQKRRQMTHQPHQQQQQPKQFNLFNIDRLKKVEVEPQLSVQPSGELAVQQNIKENPLQHTEARSLFSYRIEGNESTKYVSDLYLEQRIKKISEDAAKLPAPKESEPGTEAGKKEEGKQEDQAEEETRERNRPVRYFESLMEAEDQESRLVKCFRCGKRGHIAKNCLEERQQTKCLYCLGDHHHHDCNSRTCFKCNEQGHIAQECRSVGVQCRRCRKMGHPQKRCGAIIFLDYSRIKADQEFRERYEADDLRKLRCLAGCNDPNGHFNCHQYQHVSKLTPYAGYTRLQDQPSKSAQKAHHRQDFEQRTGRNHHDRRADRQRDYPRSSDRYRQRSLEQYQEFVDYERKPSWNGKRNHQQAGSNFDRYNDRYNVNMGYGGYHNPNQNINQRYDYRRW